MTALAFLRHVQCRLVRLWDDDMEGDSEASATTTNVTKRDLLCNAIEYLLRVALLALALALLTALPQPRHAAAVVILIDGWSCTAFAPPAGLGCAKRGRVALDARPLVVRANSSGSLDAAHTAVAPLDKLGLFRTGR